MSLGNFVENRTQLLFLHIGYYKYNPTYDVQNVKITNKLLFPSMIMTNRVTRWYPGGKDMRQNFLMRFCGNKMQVLCVEYWTSWIGLIKDTLTYRRRTFLNVYRRWNGVDDPSSNTGPGYFNFTSCKYPWERHESICSRSARGK